MTTSVVFAMQYKTQTLDSGGSCSAAHQLSSARHHPDSAQYGDYAHLVSEEEMPMPKLQHEDNGRERRKKHRYGPISEHPQLIVENANGHLHVNSVDGNTASRPRRREKQMAGYAARAGMQKMSSAHGRTRNRILFLKLKSDTRLTRDQDIIHRAIALLHQQEHLSP